MDSTNAKNVDSLMELLTEVNIGTDGVTMNYPPIVALGSSQVDNNEPNYFVDTSALMDELSENKAEDPNVLKPWREGMEIKTKDDSTAKTMFISQNLNKEYEAQERKSTLMAYSSCVSKVLRETDYFNAILNRVGEDMQLVEWRTPKEEVLEKRDKIKTKLIMMKERLDEFITKNLTGDIAPKPELSSISNNAVVIKETAEFAFIGEKKPPGSGIISLNLCVDCNVEIPILDGQDLESSMVAHSQTELHKASMPEPPPPRKSKNELATGSAPAEINDNKKALENLKKSAILRLNRITSCLIDDNVICEVCDVVFQSNVQEIFKHMSEALHKDKLNMYNMEAQKSIIDKNVEVFGENGQFQITNLHTNLHKIFVDPSIKQAYCGLCCRQLPFSQSNIDEHIVSIKHDKLLIDAVDASFAEFASLGIEASILNGIKANKQASANIDAPAPKEIKLKKDPQVVVQQQQQQQNQVLQQQNQQEQFILDATDIQNYRKVLPDKPIRCIPDILDSNNMPIHNLEYYEQPELKKFLADNGLLRQPNGKFKCLYCPNLEIPNSRYAYRHVSKHKTGSGGNNSQTFENWKRQPNRQQGGYVNEQKLGRVVMHKNGVNYWCTSCRLPLIDASTAFAHVKTDNHVMYVDGVSFSSGTIFDCNTCKTTINGEKNACQHLVAAKHRENSKLDAAAKQEGRMNMLEERKQKQFEKQKQNEAQRKEKAEYYGNSAQQQDEDRLLEKNGIAYSADTGIYRCNFCGWSNRKRNEMLTHIFSYEHTACLAKQGR